MTPALDFDAYSARVGYTGPRAATLEVMRRLQMAHVCSVPFENLDVLLGRGVRIDLGSIQEKFVGSGRGGYCFEHNTLYAAVLRTLGFEVVPLAARVRWNVPPEVTLPRTHMTLLVYAEGTRYLVDVGFGGMSVSAPLKLDLPGEQETPHGIRRIVPPDGEGLYTYQAKLGDIWSDVYRFTLEPQLQVDYEMANWFTSTYPQGRFRQNLIVARAGPDCQYALLNREFTIRQRDGSAVKRTIASPDELLAVLREHFGLHFPPETRFGRGEVPWPT